MNKVNPPAALRMPNDIMENPELKKYFDQLNTILFQMWVRSGGGADFIEDLKQDTATVSDQVLATVGVLDSVQQEYGNWLSTIDSRTNYAQDFMLRVNNLIEMASVAPPVQPLSVTRYGAFYDTTTQTAAAINTAYAITFNTTDITAGGIYRGATTSRIYVTTEGVYNFEFSAQLDNTSGGNHLAYIWARVNGTDVAQSASQVRLKGTDGELVAAWNFVLSLKPDDYFELMWSVSDTAVQLTAQAAAAPVPAIPSVILTVT